MPKIFISYRREDAAYPASFIRDRLVADFSEKEVFFDVDSIPSGHDFRKHVREKVLECDYVIVVIGRSWLTAADETGAKRLDNPADLVRLEIEAALSRDDIPVIPVLVDNAQMPKENQLPRTVSKLVDRNALACRPGRDLKHDLDILIHRIREQEAERQKQAKPPDQRKWESGTAAISPGPITPARGQIPGKLPQLAAKRPLQPGQPPPPPFVPKSSQRSIRSWLIRAGVGVAGLGILLMLVFGLKGDRQPVIDESFRDAHEKKLNVPQGWTEGDAFRIDKDDHGETFLEVRQPSGTPFVQLPTVHLSSDFYIEGVVLLPVSYHWEGILTIVLDDPQNSGNTLKVVIHGTGGVAINDDVATPLHGYRLNVPSHFNITRNGTQMSVLLNHEIALQKNLGTVANFEKIKLGMSAGTNNGAGNNKLYKLTVGAGDPGAIAGGK